MNAILFLGGLHSLFFGVFHCLFWQKLHWKTQLPRLSNTNNAVMQILNLRLIFLCFGHAILCFFYTDELLNTSLGRAVLAGTSLFWIGRTLEQFIFRRLLPSTDRLSIFLIMLFVLGSVLYLIPLADGR